MSLNRMDEHQSKALRSIDRSSSDLIQAAKNVYSIPETGFNEYKTSNYVLQRLQELGLSVESGIVRTGLKAVLRGDKNGPTVAVLAELDALRVPKHPGADPQSGAAHACGHHSQIGALLGVATALSEPRIKNFLSGNVAFILTPAEEFIDIQNRLSLRAEGELEFLSGKQEMIRLGIFDDVDMAMLVHTAAGNGNSALSIGGTSTAHVSHQVRFIGKSAHAGGAPDRGINALQAAILANVAINAQRETFQESEVVRVHGIITRGGDSVNAVPDDVLYEGRVRAGSLESIQSVADKVIRCYRAGALAIGAAVEVQTIAGYHSLKQNPIMKQLFIEKAKLILGKDSITDVSDEEIHGGSTDMGDLSAIMPVIHPYANAASGYGHGDDYMIDDYNLAVITSAKVMAATIIELLSNGAQTANRVIDTFTQTFTTSQYVTVQRERFSNTLYTLK